MITFLSELSHFLKFEVNKTNMKLEKGMLIISIDIDVGNKMLGSINKGRNDSFVHKHLSEYEIGAIEEKALPVFIDVFNRFHVPVTFAIRGQLFDITQSTIDSIIDAPVKHDIGAHGYSHKSFKTLSRTEAEMELHSTSIAMEKHNITPTSFVFPKNEVAHLDLLEQYGYTCYRECGGLIRDGMHIKKNGELYDVHPSLYLAPGSKPFFLKKMLETCIHKKLPFHLWFHLWNFGSTDSSIKKAIRNIFHPFLEHTQRMVYAGGLNLETMQSAVESLEAS